MPYFKRAERQERGHSEFHGGDGPLSVSDDRTDFEICRLCHQAAVVFGLPENGDCNDGHPEGVGSYRMGADIDAVVDPHLRVHGLDGLRIADASIMPSITSGNTNAPVVAIAEKASDLIRGAAP